MPKSKRVVFCRVDAATLARKSVLPAYLTWQDIVKRGLLAVEEEQENLKQEAKK